MEKWSNSLDFKKIQETYGTPLYLFNTNQLIENIIDFLTLLREPGNLAFPIKACPCMPVMKIIRQYGLSVDCAAPAEINMALESGFPYCRIWYNSPDLCEKTIKIILNNGGVVVANDIESLELITKINDHPEGKIFLRWNPDMQEINREAHANLTAHGYHRSQFGSSSEDILKLPASKLKCIDGLHTHIGSRIKSLDSFAQAINNLHDLVDDIFKKSGHKIATLNIGGGLKSPMNAEDKCPSIRGYTSYIKKLTREDICYVIEPGNALVGNVMGLLASVRSIKYRPGGGRFAILDVGSNQLLKYTLSGIQPSILTNQGNRLSTTGKDAIAGPLCFSGDIILAETNIDALNIGSPLLIQHCGAYCVSLSHQFNGRFRPAVLTIDNDTDNFISQMADNIIFTAASSVGVIWQTDKISDYQQNPILIPIIKERFADVLSIYKIGERSFCTDLICNRTLDMHEQISFILQITDGIMNEIYHNDKKFTPEGLTFFPQQQKVFTPNKTTSLYISVSHPSQNGIRVSFGSQYALNGFFILTFDNL